MARLRRLFQLWGLYARLDFTWMVRDFRFFLLFYLCDLLLGLAAIAGILLLTERFAGLGPWSRPQVAFLLGYAALTDGLAEVLFGYNVLAVSRRLGRGQLDHVLLQPQPLWVTFLTEGFVPFSSSAMLWPGLLLCGWALRELGLSLTPGWLVAASANLAGSIGLVLAFSFFWGSLAFWAPRSAEELSDSALRLVRGLQGFPLDGLGLRLQAVLLSAIPAGFVAWVPSLGLLGREPRVVWVTPAAALVFGLAAALVFRQGMKHYARTGSQRYHDMGHRR